MKRRTSQTLSEIIQDISEAGLQMTQLGAAEGSAGNISAFARRLDGVEAAGFRLLGEQTLPVDVPSLASGWLVISGTGRRLRDIAADPGSTLCVLEILPGGRKARWYSAGEVRPTSEMNSHLAVHEDQVSQRDVPYHAIVHAQPAYLTFLSHIPRYEDNDTFNRCLLRWEPETIIVFSDGLGMIPFQVPGSAELMAATLEGLRRHRLIVWQKHGVVARSDSSAVQAADLVEYAETAAHYEYLNLQTGGQASGLSVEEIRQICRANRIEQNFF